MNPWIKIIIGAILIVGSGYYILASPLNYPPYNLNARRDLITVIDGVIPLLLIIIGIFLIWLEGDEIRIERELEKETEKPRSRRKR